MKDKERFPCTDEMPEERVSYNIPKEPEIIPNTEGTFRFDPENPVPQPDIDITSDNISF